MQRSAAKYGNANLTFKMNTIGVAHRCEGQTHLLSCISLHLSLSIGTVSVSINSEVPCFCFLYLFSHNEISEMISDNNSCLWAECFGLFIDSTEFTVALIIQSSLRECDIYACVYLFCQYLLMEALQRDVGKNVLKCEAYWLR